MNSRILINGKLWEAVEVKSGLRQGCPLSPITFICIINPLLRHTIQDKSFKGRFLPGCGNENVKRICYMDDVMLLCNLAIWDLARAPS